MLCKKPYIVPIPGSRKEERLKENLGSIDVVLTAEEIEGIDTLLGKMVLPVYGQNPVRR
jgi:aryl-alcohol dehydrogenase-like predicted oxidoreductase